MIFCKSSMYLFFACEAAEVAHDEGLPPVIADNLPMVSSKASSPALVYMPSYALYDGSVAGSYLNSFGARYFSSKEYIWVLKGSSYGAGAAGGSYFKSVGSPAYPVFVVVPVPVGYFMPAGI